jgi:hypothetical protein
MDEQLEIVLKGGDFKRLLDTKFEKIKKKHGLFLVLDNKNLIQYNKLIFQGRVKFPTGGKAHEPVLLLA